MITTIQIDAKVKKALDRIKSEKQTYEQTIVDLINTSEKYKRSQEDLLIEGCKEMYEDSLKISGDWDSALMDGLSEDENWSK